MEPPARTNYIFVDYENVKELDLDLIAGKAVKVFLVIGTRQKSLPLVLAKQIRTYHDQVEFIASEGATQNALDLVLAYHVGVQARTDPHGYFHVVAMDKDYDALIQHLRAQKVLASRADTFSKIPVLSGAASATSPSSLSFEDRIALVLERFKKNNASRPSRKKTLQTTLHSLFHKQRPEPEIAKLIAALVEKRLIELSPEGRVKYGF